MSQLWANLGTGGTALDARNGSGTGVDSNDALLLTHDGTNYLYLPGVAGNGPTVPGIAAYDITGDLELVVDCALPDSSATQIHLILRDQAGANRCWYLTMGSARTPQFVWWDSGGTVRVATSSVAMSLADGQRFALRVSLDVDNGAGGNTVTFATAPTASGTFTTLSTVTQAFTTSVRAITAVQIALGAGNSATLSAPGGAMVCYRAIVRNGIGGTAVFDANFSTGITSGAQTTFTESSANAATVTINRSTSGRKSVAVVRPVWLLGTANYLEIADNALLDFGASDSFTVMAVVRQWATPRSFGRWVDKRQAVDFAGYGLFSNDTALSVLGVIDAGASEESRSSSITSGALSLIGMVANRTAQTLATFSGATLSSTISISGIGSLASSAPLRIGALGSGTSYQDFEVMAVAVFRRALTAGEISALSSYYASRFP